MSFVASTFVAKRDFWRHNSPVLGGGSQESGVRSRWPRGQDSCELIAGAGEALPEGCVFHAEGFGGVGRRHPLQVAEDDCLAVFRGKLGDGSLHAQSLFVAGRLVDCGRRGGLGATRGPDGKQAAAEPFFAAVSAADVDRDPREPGFEVRIAAERFSAGQGFNEDVLDEIVMVGLPGGQLANEPGDVGENVCGNGFGGRGVAGAKRTGDCGPIELNGWFEFCRRQTRIPVAPPRALGRVRLVALAR
jgi:hypothetical protein